MSEFLEAALWYAKKGLRVIPALPRTNNLFKEDWPNKATTDERQIREWWAENPNYNVALLTGQKNHLLVLDLDLDEVKGKYGYEIAQEWQQEHGSFPEDSWLEKSAHGGYRMYFWIDQPQSSPVNLFFDKSGVDIRADGAAVVVTPSVREDGLQYSWEQGPDEFDLRPANEAVWQFIRDGEAEKEKNKKGEKAEGNHKGFEMPDEVIQGNRRETLVALIGSLRAKGLSTEAIKAAVEAENEERCKPPMTDKELKDEVFPALKRDWPTRKPYAPKPVPEKRLVDKLIELDAANTFSQTDKGFAEMYVALFGNVSRYNPTKKEYMYFDGIRWALDVESMRAKNNAKKLADALRSYAATYAGIDDNKQLSEYIKHVLKMMSNRTREIMIKDAKDLNFFESDQLDAHDYWLNCQNGVIDLSGPDPVFMEHDAGMLLSKVCNAEYDPAAECPLWEKSLAEIMLDDEEKINYIQKIFGLALTGCTKEEEMYFFYGSSSRNGKSTIAETILNLLGDYGTTISPESLAAKNRDSRQASPDMAKLQGVRMVVASEPPKKMLFDVSLVKTLTGRDRITARHLYENEVSFTPIFKLIINTNYLPLITDETIFRSERIRVISFNKHFEPEEQNKDLKAQLQEELSGILNWMIRGWYKYQEEGLEPPESVRAATEEYKRDSDKLGRFIEDNLEESADDHIKAQDVYLRYTKWCEGAGLYAEGRNNFYNDLKVRGMFRESYTIDGKTVRNVVVGYRLLDEGFMPIEDDADLPFY